MDQVDLIARINALLDQAIAADEQYHDCFVVEVSLTLQTKLLVFMDADTGIDFDKCRYFSRFLEADLDAKGWLGEEYTLEVSSAGMSRPLTLARQYIKNVGRNLKVELLDGTKIEGLLTAATEIAFTLSYETKLKEGKKNVKATLEPQIQYETVAKAVVKPSFR